MSLPDLGDLQASVQDRAAFGTLADYELIGRSFLSFLASAKPTRIVSPSHAHYVFFQYPASFGHKITRPLNTNLFIEDPTAFKQEFERLLSLLADLKRSRGKSLPRDTARAVAKSNVVNRVVYTTQQVVGGIGDSFENENQARKRIGQLFENLVKLILKELGLVCEPRTIKLTNLKDAFLKAAGARREKPRAVEVEALVDTVATRLSLKPTVIKKLGLERTDTVRSKTTHGDAIRHKYSAVRLELMGRAEVFEVVELPEDVPNLIGQVPLEVLDFVVDSKGQRLIPNPAHGGEQMTEEYGSNDTQGGNRLLKFFVAHR